MTIPRDSIPLHTALRHDAVHRPCCARLLVLVGLGELLGLQAIPGCSGDNAGADQNRDGAGGAAGTAGTGGGGSSGAAGTGGSTDGGAGKGGAAGTGGSTDGSAGAAGSPDAQVPLDECATPKPEWVFCSGFEEANWQSVWDDYDGNPEPTNALMIDPGPFGHAANHVMRLRAAAGARGGADLVKVVAAHDRLYARWYVAYEPGFNFDAPNHGSALFAGDRNYVGQSGSRPSGSDFFIAGLDYGLGSALYPHSYRSYVYYPGMYQDCTDPNGSCWGDSLPCVYDTGQSYCTTPTDLPTVTPPQLAAGTWYCVELMIDGGTPTSSSAGADGGLDFWINGVEQAPSHLHHWMRASASVKPDILWISLFHHDGTHSIEGVYYDNIVVSTDRIGCL